MNASLLPSIEVPVTCPQCRSQTLDLYPIGVVVLALTLWNSMRLYCSCHGASWDASSDELQRIRDHLGEKWLKGNRP